MTINERVRYLRKEILQLNQADFGRALRIGQTGVCMLETRSSVSERNIAEICARWNVRREWLLTGEGEIFSPARPATVREELLNEPKRLDRELAAALAALDDVQLKAFKRQFSSPR